MKVLIYAGILMHWGVLCFVGCLLAVLVRRFAETQRDLARLSQSLQQEVERQTEELQRKASALQELDVQKTHFFQNVSHELRTPLTLIMAPLDSARERAPDDRDLAIAQRNSLRLYRLVNQLLDFQKLAAGKRRLQLEPVELVSFVRSCASYVRPTCERRDIELLATVEGDDAELTPDEAICAHAEIDALEKIAFNLLSNALKHTPDGGHIRLALDSAGDDRVRLSVRDDGPGIDPQQRDKLFRVFSQLDDSSTREHEGTGLGLALVRELAVAMDGDVGVDSEPGRGATFWVELPRARVPEQADAGGFVFKRWLLDELSASAAALVPSPSDDSGDSDDATGHAPADATVLVVDDLADMRQLVARALTKRGYSVMQAPNGAAGLELAKSLVPDLVVTDWMMPVMDGPGLIAAMREHDRLASVPVVLLTAKSDDESRSAGTVLGADHFLGKPFSEDELVCAVRNLLSLKAREREVEDLNRHLTEDVLKRYLSPAVVDAILAGRIRLDDAPSVASVTVLFADLVGFTELSDRIGAQATARILNEFLSSMTDVVFRHDGTIDKFMGDALMVLFGAPVEMAPRDQVQRAVACARDMQRELDELARRCADRFPDFPTQLRIGIHAGPAVVGNIGSQRRSDFTAVGAAVNLAARIQAACEPGQILTTSAVADWLAEGQATRAGEFPLKGIAHPVTLFQVSPSGEAPEPPSTREAD
jgi:adenylate cyclase